MLLEKVKARCGVPEDITVYDTEFEDLIESAMYDMLTAGVPVSFCSTETTNPLAVNAITCYVQAYRDSDRTDTDKYLKMYRDILHKLMLEPAEV